MELELTNIPIIDTHEHLADESHRVHQEKDVLSLFLHHYITTDLENAGLSPSAIEAVRDPSVAIERRWASLEPFWRKVSNTAYARALKIAVRDLYKIDSIDRDSIQEIADRVEEASKPGLYSHVFQKAGIEWAVVDDLIGIYEPNGSFETPIPRPSDPPGLMKKVIHGSPLIDLCDRGQIQNLETLLPGSPIHTLQDWLDRVESVFEKHPEAVALKLPHAYGMSLAVEKRTFHEAEQVFNRILSAPYPGEHLDHEASRPLTDYLVYHAVWQAAKRDLPIQIHTGLLEGSYNNLRNADPMHLIPLFMEYREARFVLFHGSYPWIREFIALGKMYPNVWLDMCWVWIISPQAGRTLLHEAIETIPQNKITAFGGDYIFVEGSYGHSVIARENIERVLNEKIAEGWFGVDEAKQYAQAVLHDNAINLYGLRG